MKTLPTKKKTHTKHEKHDPPSAHENHPLGNLTILKTLFLKRSNRYYQNVYIGEFAMQFKRDLQPDLKPDYVQGFLDTDSSAPLHLSWLKKHKAAENFI